ncbi:Uncharacterised protein [Mycobacterium tuberculosis]|nr:Uncharacterised protein [Mycobacterium tuberculosis]
MDQFGAGVRLVWAAELGRDHQTGAGRAITGAQGDHGAFAHSANLRCHQLDLRRKDVASRDGDDFLRATTHHQAASAKIAEVAGGKPIVRVDRLLTQVTRHHRRTANLDFANFTARIACRLITARDPYLHTGDGVTQDRVLMRTAAVDDTVGKQPNSGDRHGHRARRLGEPVGGQHGAGIESERCHRLREPRQPIAVNRLSTVERHSQGTQVDLGYPPGVFADEVVGEVRCRGHGGTTVREPTQPTERRRRERRRRGQPERRTGQRSREHESEPHVVVQR